MEMKKAVLRIEGWWSWWYEVLLDKRGLELLYYGGEKIRKTERTTSPGGPGEELEKKVDEEQGQGQGGEDGHSYSHSELRLRRGDDHEQDDWSDSSHYHYDVRSGGGKERDVMSGMLNARERRDEEGQNGYRAARGQSNREDNHSTKISPELRNCDPVLHLCVQDHGSKTASGRGLLSAAETDTPRIAVALTATNGKAEKDSPGGGVDEVGAPSSSSFAEEGSSSRCERPTGVPEQHDPVSINSKGEFTSSTPTPTLSQRTAAASPRPPAAPKVRGVLPPAGVSEGPPAAAAEAVAADERRVGAQTSSSRGGSSKLNKKQQSSTRSTTTSACSAAGASSQAHPLAGRNKMKNNKSLRKTRTKNKLVAPPSTTSTTTHSGSKSKDDAHVEERLSAHVAPSAPNRPEAEPCISSTTSFGTITKTTSGGNAAAVHTTTWQPPAKTTQAAPHSTLKAQTTEKFDIFNRDEPVPAATCSSSPRSGMRTAVGAAAEEAEAGAHPLLEGVAALLQATGDACGTPGTGTGTGGVLQAGRGAEVGSIFRIRKVNTKDLMQTFD